MEFLPPPKELKMSGDMGRNCKKWKENYKVYMIASGCLHKEKEVQAAILLHLIGEEANDVINLLNLTEEQRKNPDEILCKLDQYFIPKTNFN